MEPLVHEVAYRGEDVVNKLKSQPIVVCGCGAIGSNLIYNMIRMGFETITVIDFDRIEDHNRGTQIWGKREVNGKKAQIMKNTAFASMGININAVDKKLEQGNISKLLPKGSIVIDAFDNSESRGLVTEYCKKAGVDCLHIGLSEGYAEIVWNEKYVVTKDSAGADVCEYPLSRSICMFSVVIGIETLVRYIGEGEKVSRSVTLGDMRIMELE